MPQINAEQWRQMDLIARWLIATRASVLLMTLSSAIIGGMLAWRDGSVDAFMLLLVVVGLLFAHACNNLVNDLTDSVMGVDKDNYYRNQYGVHVLEAGLLTRRRFFLYIIATAAVALFAGFWLVWLRGGYTLPLMLAGMFFVLFYTWPLKYFGLGEPAVLLVWGPLMIGGSYYVVSGQWQDYVLWVSLCYALGPTAVLFGKHIDKADADRAKGIRSLPVILGPVLAQRTVIAMLGLQYLMVALLVVYGALFWTALIVMANVPATLKVCQVLRGERPAERPDDFPKEVWPLWYAPFTFDHTRRFSGWFVLALLIEIILAG